MKKSDMLSGLTASQWARPLTPLGKILISLGLIAGAAYFVTGATAETVPPWLYALFVVAGTTYVVTMFIAVAAMAKAQREAKAGYTTTGGKYPELPQLDSRTGEVVREIGQAFTIEQHERPRRRFK